MAVELVDGYAGRAHISSEDLAALNIGVVGVEGCVLDWGQKFSCTMSTSNKATIGTGAGMVKGLRFWAKSSESLTVQSGSQGMKRHDLVVARYKKDSGSQVESVALEVVKGAPHASAPSDPAVGADGLALWRIPLDGLSVGTPVRLAPIAPTLHSLRVERLYENDFWRIVRHGGAVSVFARGIVTESGSESYLDCKYKLPEGLRPATEVLASVVTSGGTAGGYLRVKPDGTITVGQLGGSGSRATRYGQLTFVPGM